MKYLTQVYRALIAILFCLSWFAGASAETVTFFHVDLSGTARSASNEAGTLLWRQDYRPYGQKLAVPVASAGNTIGFHGRPFDSQSGLSYMGARYYDPVLGRFLGVDPKPVEPSDLHSFNRYAYANNNPYKYVDPDGHSAIDVAFLAWDLGKLGVAMYTGVGVGAAAADVGLSMIGVVSPIPGVGQAMKAARVTEHAIQINRAAGVAREAKVQAELASQYGSKAVQREQYLRTANDKIAKDPITGTGRRIDHVVIVDGKAVKSVETTSRTANKAQQMNKEDSIREAGGTFVRDRQTGKLVDFKDVATEIVRKD